MAKKKLTSRKAETYSAKNSVKSSPKQMVNAQLMATDKLEDGSQQKDISRERLEVSSRSSVEAFLPAKPRTNVSLPRAILPPETCQHEVEVLRAAVEMRFEELHRLTRAYQLMEAKSRDVLQKLEISQSLLKASEAALANAEAQLMQKNSEISAAEKVRVALTEYFHAAVAASHPPKSTEQAKKKLQPKLRAKDMKRSESWNLLKQSWLFDGDWYLRRYPDVAQAAWDPVEHYLSFGAKEHRDPGPFFSTASYLSDNADVAEAEINPLLHYIKFGCHELRRAVPHLTK